MKKYKLLPYILLLTLSSYVFAALTIDNNESFELDSSEVLVIDNDITINGTLTGATSAQVRVNNNWTNNGVFNHGNAEVFFIGAGASVISGNNTFYDLISSPSESDTSEKTITFTANQTQTILNSVKIEGSDINNHSFIRSTSPGVQAILDVTATNGTGTFDALNVADNRILTVNNYYVNPKNSTDGGNTTSWFGVDSDGDGILDDKEALFGTNPNVAGYYGSGTDADNDLIPDSLENYIKNTYFSTNTAYTTVSLSSFTDTDGDGLPDALEVVKGYNPLDVNNPTTNGGDLTNTFTLAVEEYLNNLTPKGSPTVSIIKPIASYNDSDGDGLPDILEVMRGFDPQDANHPTTNGAGDSDGDGVNNATEYYLELLGVTITDKNLDSDKDGLPDAVEVALGSNPLELGVDINNDGINDNVQNYLNSIGVTPTTAITDYDTDGLPDILDIALPLSNNYPKTATMIAADTSIDEYLTNYARANYPGLGNISKTDDTDGDGVSNEDELKAGTSPFVADRPYGVIRLTQNDEIFAQAKTNEDILVSFDFANMKYYNDPNISYNWDFSGVSDVSVVSTITATRVITIKSPTPGTYTVKVTISENGTDYQYVTTLKLAAEILKDGDNDGIADSIDDNMLGLQSHVAAISKSLIIASVGTTKLKAQAGKIAREENYKSADITGSNSIPEDPNFNRITGIYDFEISNIPANTTTIQVVIPLATTVQVNAVYRKLASDGKWYTYPNNRVETALGAKNDCSGVTESDWGNITAGHWCSRLTLVDGPASFDPASGITFDTDGVVNGQVKDPGVFATPVSEDDDKRGGYYGDFFGNFNGCVLNTNNSSRGVFDPTLYLLILLSFIFVVKRYIRQYTN